MHRKILGICTALAALAALAVGASSASATTLRDTNAAKTETVTIAKGVKLKGISTGTSTFEGSGLKIECNENYITGEVHVNNGTQVMVTVTGAGFDSNLTTKATDCKTNLGENGGTITIPELKDNGGTRHWCLENVEGTDEGRIRGRACTGVEPETFTFNLNVTNSSGGILFTCPYDRETFIKGDFTTPKEHQGSDLTVTESPEFKREGSNILCPASGKITKMEFGIFTDTDPSSTLELKTTTWNDSASTGDPVWFENVV